jgi:uracil-DNA glycosylase family 4
MRRPSDEDRAEPGLDCPACPRLVAYRQDNRRAAADWFNAPVPSFGSVDAELLIVGLAPGLKGANRTGRPFTGDYAGDLLYATLLDLGMATGAYRASPDDGLTLVDCRITNAVRCVPPANKPTPAEITSCRSYLSATIAAMSRLKVVVVLGRIAHDSTLSALGAGKSQFPFAHGRRHQIHDGLVLYDSYHCSRYNTNTGVLTPAMFRAVMKAARDETTAPPVVRD